MDTFFSHENHAWPPSLAENGHMRTPENKSDILSQLETLGELHVLPPDVNVKVVDGAALVQSLDPKLLKKKVKTFKEYSEQIFIPNVLKKLQSCERCDIVWDVYRQCSLNTRQQRGDGQRMHVNGETTVSPFFGWMQTKQLYFISIQKSCQKSACLVAKLL